MRELRRLNDGWWNDPPARERRVLRVHGPLAGWFAQQRGGCRAGSGCCVLGRAAAAGVLREWSAFGTPASRGPLFGVRAAPQSGPAGGRGSLARGQARPRGAARAIALGGAGLERDSPLRGQRSGVGVIQATAGGLFHVEQGVIEAEWVIRGPARLRVDLAAQESVATWSVPGSPASCAPTAGHPYETGLPGGLASDAVRISAVRPGDGFQGATWLRATSLMRRGALSGYASGVFHVEHGDG